MIVVGIILLLLGYLLGVEILWIAGVVLLLVGLVLLALSMGGNTIAGRRYWY